MGLWPDDPAWLWYSYGHPWMTAEMSSDDFWMVHQWNNSSHQRFVSHPGATATVHSVPANIYISLNLQDQSWIYAAVVSRVASVVHLFQCCWPWLVAVPQDFRVGSFWAIELFSGGGSGWSYAGEVGREPLWSCSNHLSRGTRRRLYPTLCHHQHLFTLPLPAYSLQSG